MEPGEYAPVSFRVETAKPNARYELVQPERIMRSTFEVAPVKLQQPVLTREPHLPHYYLTGLIRNDLKRPFTGIGLVMLYSADGRLVGSGIGSIDDLNPGEATKITMNGFLFHENAEVASYEYLLDMFYKNERESVSMQDVERLGSTTVPNRIVRVNNPQITVLPEDDGFLKP